MLKPLAAVVLLALGAVVGVAAVALHSEWWTLALVVVTTAVTVYAVPPGWWGRLAFAVGFVGVVGYVTFPRPEGDYVVSGDLSGYTLLGSALLVLVWGLGTLPRPARGSARGAARRPGP